MAATLVPKDRIPWAHLILVGWLPGPLKRLVYRLKGYHIGRGVRFGPFGIVVGRDVTLADHVAIGAFAIVQGRTIRIGRHSSVGTFSYVACEQITIGEDAKIREQVFVGGPQFPDSLFEMGDRTIILQMAYLNPTRPLRIGNDTGIGGHCLIFTHGAWLNQLDGYPADYKPVTIGASVWLPWRVFVMPGATIGDGSVIGANSLVNGAIPARSLAVGSPAKVIRSAPDFPKTPTPEDRDRMVHAMLAEFDGFVGYHGVTVQPGATGISYAGPSGRFRLHRRPRGAALPTVARGDTVLAEEPLDAAARAALSSAGAFWLDLAGRTRSEGGSPLTEELALFLGRYGIRLPRARG